MSKIQLLTGPAVQESLEITGVRQLFRYQLNPATVGLLFVFGIASFGAALFLVFGPGLGGGYTAGFAIALALGMTFFSMVSFWSNFKTKYFIGVSDEFLYVGKDDKAWRIHWELVNRDSLNFDEMQNSKMQGKIFLEAAGQSVEIPLFTPFVFIEDIEGFMFHILQRLEADTEQLDVDQPDTNKLHREAPSDQTSSADDCDDGGGVDDGSD